MMELYEWFHISAVILILLVFVVSGLVFIVVTMLADFCAAPASNVLRVTGLSSNDVATYFLTYARAW